MPTLLPLPTAIFYAQGVKANVLFFDPAPWTRELWVYDFRTNRNFTLKQNPLSREHLNEFVACFNPENRHQRQPNWSQENPDGRWRAFSCEDLMARDKVNLDSFWLRDECLEDTANLPDPDVLALERVGSALGVGFPELGDLFASAFLILQPSGFDPVPDG